MQRPPNAGSNPSAKKALAGNVTGAGEPPSQPPFNNVGIRSLSIFAMTSFLVAGLVALIIGLSVFHREQALEGATAIAAHMKAQESLSQVTEASLAFNDLKFWYAAMASNGGQTVRDRVETSRVRLADQLEILESKFPDAISRLRQLTEDMDTTTPGGRDDAADLFSSSNQAVLDAESILAELVDDHRRESGIAAEAVRKTTRNSIGAFFPSIGVSLIFGIAVILILLNLVMKPVRKMTQVTRALARNELDVEIPAIGGSKEMSAMSQALKALRNNLRNAHSEREHQTMHTEQARKEKRAEIISVANHFEQTVSSAIAEISNAAQALSNNSGELRTVAEVADDQSSNAAMSASDAARNIQAVSAATEELTASIREVVKELGNSVSLTSEAVEISGETSIIVNQLGDSSAHIDAVVQLISDIAEQTNLLALNATIEAARAGEAGRGFAVVASEVKNLAVQTSEATGDITGRIEEIKSAASSAVSAIGRSQDIIARIEERIVSVSSAAEEQSATTAEISRSVHEAAQSSQSISSIMQELASSATQTGSTAKKNFEAARNLTEQATILEHSVEGIIGQIRKAG